MSPLVRRTRCRGAFGVACTTLGRSTIHRDSPDMGSGLPHRALRLGFRYLDRSVSLATPHV